MKPLQEKRGFPSTCPIRFMDFKEQYHSTIVRRRSVPGSSPYQNESVLKLERFKLSLKTHLLEQDDKIDNTLIHMIYKELIDIWENENTREQALQVLPLMECYIRNILISPWKDEFKIIKKYNGIFATRILAVTKYGEDFIRLIGYKKNDQTYELQTFNQTKLIDLAYDCCLAQVKLQIKEEYERKSQIREDNLMIMNESMTKLKDEVEDDDLYISATDKDIEYGGNCLKEIDTNNDDELTIGNVELNAGGFRKFGIVESLPKRLDRFDSEKFGTLYGKSKKYGLDQTMLETTIEDKPIKIMTPDMNRYTRRKTSPEGPSEKLRNHLMEYIKKHPFIPDTACKIKPVIEYATIEQGKEMINKQRQFTGYDHFNKPQYRPNNIVIDSNMERSVTMLQGVIQPKSLKYQKSYAAQSREQMNDEYQNTDSEENTDEIVWKYPTINTEKDITMNYFGVKMPEKQRTGTFRTAEELRKKIRDTHKVDPTTDVKESTGGNKFRDTITNTVTQPKNTAYINAEDVLCKRSYELVDSVEKLLDVDTELDSDAVFRDHISSAENVPVYQDIGDGSNYQQTSRHHYDRTTAAVSALDRPTAERDILSHKIDVDNLNKKDEMKYMFVDKKKSDILKSVDMAITKSKKAKTKGAAGLNRSNSLRNSKRSLKQIDRTLNECQKTYNTLYPDQKETSSSLDQSTDTKAKRVNDWSSNSLRPTKTGVSKESKV